MLLDKEKYETQFYNMVFLYELQSQLETMNDEKKRGKEVNPDHLNVIQTNLPVLTEYAGLEAYQGDYSYDSLREYMKNAEKILSKKSNRATLDKEAVVDQFVRENGKEALLELKKNHHNLKLEDFVVGADQGRMLDIVDGHIVPRVGPIFLTPHNQMGRAPFYSSEKIVAGIHVKTLWFNMGIIFLMCIVATILLMADWPGRIIRKESSTQ